jgi:type IV secretory pathway VirB10-like protein
MMPAFAPACIAWGFTVLLLTACAAAPTPPPRVEEPTRLNAAEAAPKPEPPAPPATPPPIQPPPPVVIVQEVAPGPNPPVNEEEQQTIALLADLQKYATSSAEELRRELASATQAVVRSRTEVNRVRLAVLITLSAAGPTDDARALGLLESVVGKAPVNTPIRQLAAVLYAQIAERVRNVAEERKKTQQAQEKLDQLRAVERSLLLERNRNSGGAGGGGGGGGTGR